MIAVLSIVLLVIVEQSLVGVDAQCAASKDPKGCYTTRYDKVNVEMILTSDRLLRRYVDCMLDKGPCTREGLFLKEIIPDVMQTECQKCNDYQKVQAGKILAHMLQYKRDWWNDLLQKYDATGLFRRKYGIDEQDEDYEDDDGKKNNK